MATASVAGVSTLKTVFGYALETTKGTKPTAFTLLNRVSSIGGISQEPETIDASALEDTAERSVAGRSSSGGSFTVTINLTDETATEWETLIAAYTGRSDTTLRMWFETYNPNLNKAFFVVAQPPLKIPQPEYSSNELLTVEMQLTIEEYIGMDTAVVPQ